MTRHFYLHQQLLALRKDRVIKSFTMLQATEQDIVCALTYTIAELLVELVQF